MYEQYNILIGGEILLCLSMQMELLYNGKLLQKIPCLLVPVVGEWLSSLSAHLPFGRSMSHDAPRAIVKILIH